MNTYQKEQLEALTLVRRYLDGPGAARVAGLGTVLTEYLAFRKRVAAFLEAVFHTICTEKCYQGQLSACCAKDGIITFFADVVVNALVSSVPELERLAAAIFRPYKADKCIFLTENGCAWRIKPVVCEFFLCDEAEQRGFENDPGAREQWEAFKIEKNAYTWPDRPVLFESIESEFIAYGHRSPLMYLHNSPGLLRVRRTRDESPAPHVSE